MELTEELRDRVGAFVAGRSSLAELRRWMNANDDALDGIEDETAVDLIEAAWTLFAEWDYGHRDKEGVRLQLREALSPARESRGRSGRRPAGRKP